MLTCLARRQHSPSSAPASSASRPHQESWKTLTGCVMNRLLILQQWEVVFGNSGLLLNIQALTFPQLPQTCTTTGPNSAVLAFGHSWKEEASPWIVLSHPGSGPRASPGHCAELQIQRSLGFMGPTEQPDTELCHSGYLPAWGRVYI